MTSQRDAGHRLSPSFLSDFCSLVCPLESLWKADPLENSTWAEKIPGLGIRHPVFES